MSKKNKIKRAKLIANPGAGNVVEAAARLEKVVQVLTEKGLKVDVAVVHPKKEAIPIVKKAIKKGYDLVISMGGDGTLGAVIRGLAGSKIKLGIIPSGTENDFATSLGIPEDMEKACEIIAAGYTHKVDLGQISTGKTKKYPFPMVVTVGLSATIYPMISQMPHGKLDGVKDAIMSLVQFDTKPVVMLTLDNESKIKIESMLVTIANTPLIGAKNLVAPQASLDDGLLDIAVYPGFTKPELLGYFLQTAHKGVTPDERIQRFRARKIKIQTSPKLDIAAEGIIMGKGSASIKVLPKALRVFVPEPVKAIEKPSKKTVVELPAPVSPVTQKNVAA